MRFDQLGFEPQILQGLEAMGFTETTPVQEQAIPAALEGRDVLACAQTGTGKTAAFLLPILNKLTKEPIEGIDTVIIEPTRELAIQVDQQLEGFSYFTGVSSVAIYGGRDGHSMSMEMKALKTGVDVVVATPGRFLSHLQLGYVDLSTIRHLVLDEADRMLDMGFVTDIMTVVNKTPKNRQTLLFSATMPSQIRKFANNLLRNPLEVSIAISKPAEGITQAAYLVNEGQKNSLIEYLLRRQDGMKKRILIFASSKKNTKELAAFLSRHGYPAADIHSDLDQKQREDTLLAFRNNSVPILVATDVLSRGIDIRGIDVVINYDVPGDPEDYVHRIGRTARADETGLALTLVTRATKRKFDNIERLTDIKVPILPLPDGIEDVPVSRGHGRRGSGGGGRRPRGHGGRGRGGGNRRGSNRRGSHGRGRSDSKG